mmetsp:Transcript_3114/g.5234  ORF Transcript_3114/g.5234 Transcript_3114/m.5234 type:complete len:101 (-) Transcript_3114:112-414(-)
MLLRSNAIESNQMASHSHLISSQGRGRGGKGRGPPRKLDKSSLDDDLDSYMLRDKKSGTHKLNEDLDDYFKKAKEAKEKDGEEAAPQEAGKATTEEEKKE